MLLFQSTLPRGERLGSPLVVIPNSPYFNPRSHEGSDYTPFMILIISSSISIHAPTRGATRGYTESPITHINFNPRSHEGSDKDPTERQAAIAEFQSTLPRGERPPQHGYTVVCCSYFNPRSHEGSDYVSPSFSSGPIISIHAPTRGATQIPYSFFPPFKFQSTLPRGERLNKSRICLSLSNFNPRSHEGSDPVSSLYGCYRCNFNPRSHEGSDITSGIIFFRQWGISIHAPTRGATLIS